MKELRDSISKAISETPDRNAVNLLVHTSSRMALAYLLQKVRRGSLDPDRYETSLEDLAIDCCSNLFEQNEHGRRVRFESFVQQTDRDVMSEAELEILLRRIVFSQVNEDLFNRGFRTDPDVLELTARLKNALEDDGRQGLRLIHAGGGMWLVHEEGDPERFAFPLVPVEILEAVFSGQLHGDATEEQILEVVSGVLEEHRYYRSRYPLQAVAEAAVFVLATKAKKEEKATVTRTKTPELILRSELDRAFETVDRVVQRVAASARPRRPEYWSGGAG